MFVSCLDAFRLLHIAQALVHTSHVDEGQSLIEQDLCGKESELEAELLIVSIKG
jgi:hypothetical protein